FSSKNPSLDDASCSSRQLLSPLDETAKPRQQGPSQQGRLLSYLAQPTAPSPPPLVVGLLLAEPNDDVFIVARRCLLVGGVPLATSLGVPRALAPGGAARHLAIANSWIRDELGATLAAAAGVCCFHPGMVSGQLLLPLLPCLQPIGSAAEGRAGCASTTARRPSGSPAAPVARQAALASVASTAPHIPPPELRRAPAARHARPNTATWVTLG